MQKLSGITPTTKSAQSTQKCFIPLAEQAASMRKACAGRFQGTGQSYVVTLLFCYGTGKRTGPITKWPPRRLLFTRLEIVFVAISPFTKRTKVVPKVFQESECCLEGLINLACGLQLQMLPRLNGHFMNVLVWFCT